MCIIRINSISNLGTFSNFSWNDQICDSFKRYNFFYGWNYSGKTMLSRLFRCLEHKQCHPDFQILEFDIKTDGENITHSNFPNNNLSIRVFNEDFVDENFKWNDENHRVNPVLILGKESIELNEKLREKEELKKEKETKKDNIQSEKSKLENSLSTSLTNKASEIRKILSITNPSEFHKTTLEDRINQVKDNYNAYILGDDVLQSNLDTFRNQKNYEVIEETNIDFKLCTLMDKTNNLLTKEISAQQIIQKLKDNPTLNNWVRQGIDLHQNEVECQFCGNKLPDDLFDRLNKHFSREYDELIKEIEQLEKEILDHKSYLERITFTDKARFFETFQETYESKKVELEANLRESIKTAELLLEELKQKRNKPFEVIDKVNIEKNPEEIAETQLNELNNIIKENNTKIKGLSEEKSKIKEKLLNHYSAFAIDEIEYFRQKDEIKKKQTELETINQEIQNLETEINTIKNQIIPSNVGAEKINNYLREFFGDDQLQLRSLGDGSYQIVRKGVIAKNLSTGEKNIIALIYFITKLEEYNFNLSDAIIFIDDPVSSLDCNHTFKIYGFLSEKVLKCKQLFITTHNFDFFNLLKDLVKGDPEGMPNRQNKNDKENFYLIKKISDNNQRCSTIENLPIVLKRFRSEYNYLFSILKKYNDTNDKSNFELLYILPNIARRFLEAYLFQKYPDGKKFKDKCTIFFNGVEMNKKQAVLKLLDEYSHEENPEHALKFPDINEIDNCVNLILELLEKKDQEHYNALIQSLNE